MDKALRGVKTDCTVKILHKDYYNFIRIHQELGTTSAHGRNRRTATTKQMDGTTEKSLKSQ
jgi:hypothetical protein